MGFGLVLCLEQGKVAVKVNEMVQRLVIQLVRMMESLMAQYLVTRWERRMDLSLVRHLALKMVKVLEALKGNSLEPRLEQTMVTEKVIQMVYLLAIDWAKVMGGLMERLMV